MERITLEELERKKDSHRKVIAVAAADWCGQCRMLKQVIEKHTEQYPHVHFYELDVEGEKLWNDKTYPIKEVPTLLLFETGELSKELVGYQYEQDLLKLLDQFKN